MRKRLLLLSFAEGAIVMVAELCGAKLLAPVYGSSLYVWASVMGVTLGALAAGYYLGAFLSGKNKKSFNTLFWVLSTAALFNMLMPALSYYAVPRISYLSFLPGVVLSTVLLLFPAIFLLGAASPLLISLQTNETNSSGKVSGIVYAVSTTGGIFATFFCGFYAIPELGLSLSLIISGGLLFSLNIALLKIFRPGTLFMMAAVLFFDINALAINNNNLLQNFDGILGTLKVMDEGRSRMLFVNDIVQSEMNKDSRKSVSGYVKLLDTLIPNTNYKEKALVLGLGAGLTANMLVEKGYETEGVEFDPRIISIAQDYFFLKPEIKTVSGDARYFLNNAGKKYKIVLFDVFKAEEQPSHVATVESLEKLKNNLYTNSLVFINWHGYTRGDKGMGTQILLNTLLKAGYSVKLTSSSNEEDHRNVMFVASLQPLKTLPFEISEPKEQTKLVNTDDQPLLEKHTASANKAWRLSYLRYYQGK
ncbi:MAG: fused MFS/spermidine synthase [Bacteroidia bacterium]|nr:fused MFS/spermidine synthase [Bacteroidia bacterium]